MRDIPGLISRIKTYYRNTIHGIGTPVTYAVNNRNGTFTHFGPFNVVIKKYSNSLNEDMLGSINQNTFKCYVLGEDLIASGIKPREGDKIYADNTMYNIEGVDQDTRTINLEVICYVLNLKG